VRSTGAPKIPRPEASTAGEPVAVRQVREAAQALLAEGKVEEAFEFCVSALDAVLRKTSQLELLLAKMQKQRLGTRSERIDPAQLQMLFEELCRQGGPEPPADPEVEAREDAELDREIEEAEQAGKEHGTTGGQRRRQAEVRTAGVERRIHRMEVPQAERHCVPCGVDKHRIGEDVTTSLEYVPGHLVQHEYHQEKYACPKCREGVTTAEGPERVIERNTADASLLAHVVVSKYVDHCPLHRLHNIYARSGALIPVSTLSDWAGEVADLLEPLANELGRRILAAHVVKTDATGIKVLAPMSPQNIERGTMWCYVGDDRDVVFRYAPTGEGETGPWKFLAERTGYVQADAASVFDRLFNGQVASAVEIGCWAHGRRRLVDLQDMDCRVAYPLKLIGRLYRIEHLADAKGLSIDLRTSLRKQRSQGILDRLKRWLVTTHASEPPSADLAKATAYILNQWTALTRFVEDGRLSLDNNVCEQQLRAIALGRRNYLFCGSHKAAARAAVLYSLTRTCAQHGVPPLPYLTDILRRLARGWPHSRLEELLPHRWQDAPANQG
jgi:transposase